MTDLKKLSRTDLEEQAELLTIAFTANDTDATLRKKIATALGEISEEAPALSHPSVAKDEKRVTIIVNKSETDKQPVVVGVNGKNYVMKRGEPVSVPLAVVEILNNATKLAWDSEMTEYAEVPRYPYQLVAQ
ncbi:hypothetical protein KC887_03490 [Candidatus Kaiserbacteria bacterium]|nr:hypothetical protein [Candidatus Kaiserbacteria bacterium]